MDLSARSHRPELMDDERLDPAIYQRCINDLASVNRVTFTHRAVLRWLDLVTKTLDPAAIVSILDVAYGNGDLLRAIARWGRRRRRGVRLSGVDLNPRSAAAARAATAPRDNISFHSGDVFSHRPAAPVDFIVTSQFTHHLNDDAVVSLLRWLDANAERGWYITDLQRHAFPHYGFRWLARLMFWHPIVRYDGTVSIARGFRRAEWQGLLGRAGIDAQVKWLFPFRYGISRIKTTSRG